MPKHPHTRQTMRAALTAAHASLPTTTHRIIFDAAAVSDIEKMNADLEQLVLEGSDSRYGDADTRQHDLAVKIEKRRDSVPGVDIELVALPFGKWDALVGDHPARDGNEDDKVLGVNTETFFPLAVRACTTSPDVSDDDDWQEFCDTVAGGEWNRLCITVWRLNKRSLDVPKSPTVSAVLNAASGDSARPPASD